jgi:hypothetical protein
LSSRASSAVERYWALAPGDYPLLDRLTVRGVEERGGEAVELELVFAGKGDGRLVVRCSGVRKLEFVQPWTSNMLVGSLRVTDISDRQWERIWFEVRDEEEECVSFICETFDAEVVSGRG